MSHFLTPERITLTGPDDRTDISALIAFQHDFPQTEIGILVKPGFTGQSRFPKDSWIDTFCQDSTGHRALHLCEDAIFSFLEHHPACWRLAQKFGRVQLNVFQSKRPVDPHLVDQAARVFYDQTGGRIIIPINPQNEQMVLALTEPNIDIIFDRSGGRGILAGEWPPGFPDRSITYAGGLNPDNVAEQVKKMIVSANGRPFNIDIETGVRTCASPDDKDGIFDIGKCRTVMLNLGF